MAASERESFLCRSCGFLRFRPPGFDHAVCAMKRKTLLIRSTSDESEFQPVSGCQNRQACKRRQVDRDQRRGQHKAAPSYPPMALFESIECPSRGTVTPERPHIGV